MIYLERFIREITYLGIACLFKIPFIYKFTYLKGESLNTRPKVYF